MNTKTQKSSYPALLRQVKDLIRTAQYEALKAVNKERIRLYWDIGQMIVRRQKAQGWGKSIKTKLQPLVAELSWSHITKKNRFYNTLSRKANS